MIHTNRCKHCGKTKEHHFFTLIPNQSGFCDHVVRRGDNPRMFEDSGLAALEAHKEELYKWASILIDEYWRNQGHEIRTQANIEKLESILNQIEKEK